ncbi:MAG: dTDP-glucose 4,6-dehydratase [Parcubacteria group bacterium Gr01-1014_56]|nr:MAG: dTDP-glucose 4,6-dehydratase [Parcubacteria group bacterium Gr01-1014_56]
MKGTILVTGGAGFIGSNFIRHTLSKYPKTKVVCIDLLTYAGNKDNLKGLPNNRLIFVKGDIANKALVARLVKKYKPTYVVHFAAESHVDRSIHGGAETFVRTNVLGTAALLSAIKNASSIKKIVHVSTDEVYGALPLKGGKKFTEESLLLPNSPYASSKAASDLVARSFFKTYNLPVVITRCSNNYGPYQYFEKLIPFSIMRLMGGNPITIYGDGKYVRDWIHVEDHSSALLLALKKGIPGEIYNIGADDEVSNLALAHRLLKYFKKSKSAITHVKDRPGHDRRYAINASKIRRELGWKPKHTFNKSFETTVAWYVEHMGWMKKALARTGRANTHL